MKRAPYPLESPECQCALEILGELDSLQEVYQKLSEMSDKAKHSRSPGLADFAGAARDTVGGAINFIKSRWDGTRAAVNSQVGYL